MSASRHLPKPDPKGDYIVVPFETKYSPFRTSEPDSDYTGECAIITLQTLQRLQPGLREKAKKEWIAFKDVMRSHRETSAKIMRRDMPGYGQGAFSREKIPAKNYLLYPGKVMHLEDVVETSYEYRLELSLLPNVVFDAKQANGQARYFQHLPKTARAEAKDLSPAIANLEGTILVTSFSFNDKSYYLPLAVFYADADIAAGVIMGYDYGEQYWQMRQRFTHFKTNGDPIPDYQITLYNDNFNASGNPRAYLDNYIARGYCIGGMACVVATQESLTVLKKARDKLPALHGATDIIIPSLLVFHLNNNVRFLSDHELTQGIFFQLKSGDSSKCPGNRFVRLFDEVFGMIALAPLKNASLEELALLAKYCQDYLGVHCELMKTQSLKTANVHTLFKHLTISYALAPEQKDISAPRP